VIDCTAWWENGLFFLCARDLQCDARERYERQQERHLAVAERLGPVAVYPLRFLVRGLGLGDPPRGILERLVTGAQRGLRTRCSDAFVNAPENKN